MCGRKHCLLSQCLATLLVAVLMFGVVGYAPKAKAETSFKVGNATITADCVSHSTAVKTANTNLTCNNSAVGSGKHQCCWGYTAAIYKKIWGTDFYYRNSATKNNLLRNLSADERLCTEANLKKFFAQTKPGAVLRIDAVSTPDASDGGTGHTMLFLALGSDGNGGYFYEGNYNGKGNTRIVYHTWAKIASYGKKYIKYIYWQDAPTFTQDYTTVDNKKRIGVSIKPASGEDQCYVKEKPYENSNDKSDSVPKGNTVKIVGAVKNKHGNTWYKIASGGFVWEGDVTVWEYSDLFSLSANFKNKKDQTARIAPYSDSDKAKTYPAGESFKVKSFVTNSYGNVWAELADGSFLNFYDKGADVQNMDFVSHVTKPSHSTTYPQGDIKVTSSYGFLFKGDVKADVPFLSLTARVIDRETEKDVSATGSPCTLKPAVSTRTINLENTKIDGKTMDSIVLVRKLNGSTGWYRYELNAQFGFTYEGKTFKFGNEYNFVSSDFTVGNPGTLETVPTPEPPGGEEEPPAGDIGARVPGDANEDGAANTADALMIMQYVSGFDVYPNMRNADCNGDGEVNTADALRIMQHISGFDVELV
ncbi:MAG: dockerin type I repeat-containing protein [Clostridia bacterium]|nr:dockerin type I repeat-containing protein [Clostridia bacterium]